MPTIYETKWLRRHFGWTCTEGSGDYYRRGQGYLIYSNSTKIDATMNEILAELGNEWEIKSVIPLIATIEYTMSATSPYTDGVLIMCQRSFEISEEELAKRRECENRTKRAAAIRREPVEVTKGLWSGARYVWRGRGFDTEAEALRQREEEAIAEEKGSKEI